MARKFSERLTERTQMPEGVANGDLTHIVDISDTSQNPDGSSYKIQFVELLRRIPTDYVDFNTSTSDPGFWPGRLRWNPIDETLDLDTGTTDVTLQLGQEMQQPTHKNGSGVKLFNGNVVYLDTNGELQLAKADSFITAGRVAGLVTHDIEIDAYGIVTTFGLVRDLDTAPFTVGFSIYLSADVAGEFVTTIPEYPNYIIKLGTIETSHASTGSVLVNRAGRTQDIQDNGWNGDFLEPVNFLVSSDGATITGSLERAGGGDLTMNFSDGFTNLDTTPPATITLTPGSAS
ncbi:MAG: hypothetical protein KAS32_06940, partial [Candidatus Peribacteraceae bacterium]|nr:hypothetical protein [Candidatus Peribacteraceae bacterium]